MKKQVSKNDDFLLYGFITQAIAWNFYRCCFDLSSDVSDFTWKDGFYFNSIFFTQLLIDLFYCKMRRQNRIPKKSVVASGILSAAGLSGLAFCQSSSRSLCWHFDQCNHIYAMEVVSSEVLVSPIVKHVHFDNKGSVMSLLHSFYCWGSRWCYLTVNDLFCHLFGI